MEKLLFAVTRAAEGYEDDSGFHWTEPDQAMMMITVAVAPV